MIAGAIAIPTLPIARFPELAPPSVTVMAIYTGANAQAVESAVTTPLEQAINGVEGLAYLQSSSTNSGISTITATFDIDRNPDLAAIDVQNRVNQALGRMPADVRTNGITVTKNTAGFMGGLGFFSKDNRYDAQFISNYLDRYVRDAVKRVPGVGDVIIFGERRYAMRLWLDPGKLAARGLTGGDVVNALREQNVQVAAGALGDAPAAADQMFNLSVRAQGRLTEASEFADVVVSGGKDGALVRVRDLGRVELGAENYASNAALPRTRGLGHGHRAAAHGQRARGLRRRARRDDADREELPARPRVAAGVRQRDRGARVDRRGAEDAGRGARARRARDVPVPAELAEHDHSRRSPFRCRSSARLRSSSSSASRSIP